MKESFYINYFYHLRLFFSSFSTKIQATTARETTPVINPINNPNANILLTLLYIQAVLYPYITSNTCRYPNHRDSVRSTNV